MRTATGPIRSSSVCRADPLGLERARGLSLTGWLLSVAVLVLVSSAAPAQPADGTPPNWPDSPAMRAGTDAIAERPQEYYEDIFQVIATAEEVFNSNLVSLDGGKLSPGYDVLVLLPRPTGTAPQGATLRVIGRVRRFNKEQFGREYEWFDKEWFGTRKLRDGWEGKPVIIANSVRSTDGREYVQGLPDYEIRERPTGRTSLTDHETHGAETRGSAGPTGEARDGSSRR